MNLIESAKKFFGIELPDADYEEEIGSPVRRQQDDGAAEIVAAGGAFFQGYDRVFDSIQTEQDLITEFRKLACLPEVDNAIQEIVNDAIVYPKSSNFPVKLDLQMVDMSDKIKGRIVEEFDKVLHLLEFDEKAHIRFRQWYIDGRLPIFIDTDAKKKKADSIESLVYIDPKDIKKIRKVSVEDNEDGVEVISKIEEMYLYVVTSRMNDTFLGRTVNTYTIDGEKFRGTKLTADSVVYATSGLNDEDGNVLSHLYNAVKPANMLDSLEESMVIYRMARAPERRVFYVDVGNLPTQKAETYLQGLIAKYKNKVSYDSKTGTVSSAGRQKTMLEDYWLPRRDGGKGTEISTVGGDTGFASIIDEVQYFKHKLYTALNVPISRLESESTFSFGKEGEITRDEVKFNKFIENLRNRFAHQLFTDLLKTQGLLSKLFTLQDWDDVIAPNLLYVFEEDSYFSEIKELDVLQNRMEALDGISEFTNIYFSKEYVQRHVLFQTEEDIEELKKQRDAESDEEEKEDKDWGNVYVPPEGEFGDEEGGGFGGEEPPVEEPEEKPKKEPKDDEEDKETK